jgi:hypothetical protein
MEVRIFVNASQLFAKYLHGVAGARDVAVPASGMERNQDWFDHVPAWG